MRHQAVMGVVAVACVAVVSAPMLGARSGVHHRGGPRAERHQYLSGIDFTQDPAVAEAAAGGVMMMARLETGALAKPEGPPKSSEDSDFSPFIGITPPALGGGPGGLQQPAGPQASQETPSTPTSQPMRYSSLVQAIGEVTPPEVPPPVLPPEPTVVPDPPPPPEIVVVVAPQQQQPPPALPPPEGPPAPPPPEERLAPLLVTPGLVTPTLFAVVPEPATWLMLVLGFGAIGSALRRHRRARLSPEGAR